MNKLRGIILVVISVLASIMMPFNLYADQLPQSEVVGVSWNLIDTEISLSSGGNWYTYTYELEVKLKNKYVGVVNGTLSYSYSDVQSSSSTPTQKTSTTTKTNYVNGDSFKFNVYISNIGSQFTGNGPMFNCSYLINNSTTNVTKYEDLNSIESVVNVLSDIYQNSSDIEGLSTNQLTELEKIVSNTSLANQYLETISKIKQYNIPYESFSFNYYLLNKYESDATFYGNEYMGTYPIFKTVANQNLYYTFLNSIESNFNHGITFVIGSTLNLSNQNQIFSEFNIDSTKYSIQNYKYLNYINGFYIVKFDVVAKVTDYFILNCPTADKYIVGFYANFIGYNKNVSTDFALQFGLSNQFLDNINIIANGNQASNNASQQLDSDTSDFNTDRDDLIDIEDSMGNSMDSAMNQITPNNNGLSGFGGNFLTSAVWVRTQFERLTNNTPYGSLIVYGMTLGLALLLLGKVML